MEQEQARAEAMGYDDPINPDYEATNAMYNGYDSRKLPEIGNYLF
jgi:hypothetical protein